MAKRKPKSSKPAGSEAGAAPRATEPDGPATEPTAEGVNNTALEAMALSADEILRQIKLIQAGQGGESKHDPASRVAFLGARAGVLFEATRKARAALAKELSAITPALVLAWYRQLDRTERERILSELHAADSRRSGLA